MHRMFLNNQSCPNQMLAFDPHIVTESGRIKPFLPGSTRTIGFWGFLTRESRANKCQHLSQMGA